MSESQFRESHAGVFYQIFVRSFRDSNGDGIGDLKGIIESLDYLNDGNPKTNTDLGVSGIWLTPIFQSPSTHGYDVSDYYKVNPTFGTMADLKRLLQEAEKRGIKVLLDLVLNHTSSQHPYFMDALKNVDSPYRDWFIWSDKETNLNEQSAIQKPAWHASPSGYYFGVFSEHTPDLNYQNTDVQRFAVEVAKYWLSLGVDGFRVDAAKHIFDDFSTSALDPQTALNNQQMWQAFRAQVNEAYPNAWLISEVWDNPETIAPYLDRAFDSSFNFVLARHIIQALQHEKPGNFAATTNEMYQTYRSLGSDKFVDGIFLSNHDKDRLMTAVNQDLRKAKLAASLLLTLPGTVYVYYGEELGVRGAKENDQSRLPFPWSAGGKSAGQTNWMSDKTLSALNTKHALDTQLRLPDSIYNHYRSLIHFRNSHKSLQIGDVTSYPLNTTSVESYLRVTDDEKLLVLHNMSGQSQSVALPLDEQTGSFSNVLFSSHRDVTVDYPTVTLPPYGSVILSQNAGSPNAQLQLDQLPPTKPGKPQATAVGTYSATVSWEKSKDNIAVKHYELEVDGKRVANIAGNTHKFQALQPGKTFSVRVRAVDLSNRVSTFSDRLTFTTKVPKPGLTIYFKKPKKWQTAYLYYYNPSPKSVPAVTWANAPEMVPMQDGWYKYTVESTKSAYVMFKDQTDKQIPAPKKPGFLRTSSGWFDGTKWSATQPKSSK
jgi:alpha-amylase